jgi:transglutaminase-like putative cysteine protease
VSRALALVAAIALAFAASARAEWTLVEERFYTLALAGNACGRSTERIEKDGDRVRSTSRIEMRFARLGQETTIDLTSEFIENARGEAIEATVAQKGAAPVRYVFETQRKVRIERGAVRETRELPDADWLTPQEVAAFVAARSSAMAEEIRFRALDLQSGFVVTEITMRRKGEVERPVLGRPLNLANYETRSSVQPISSSELYDAKGLLVESSTSIGIGELVSALATRAQADESYARASFDLLSGTFVASKPIRGYERRATLAIEIEGSAGDLIDLPSEGCQRFTRISQRSARIDVDLARGSAPADGDATNQRWLKPTELIDSDSAEVRALLAEAKLKPEQGAFDRANALRALVARHLRAKNLATAFGSASEAARSRSGDCTEHAVLLAALLRAEGIPARVASGLVYVPDLSGAGPGWGWHLWTQALVEPKGGGGPMWTDFDATVAGEGRGYHVAHILVASSDLAGGATDPAFSRAVSLIGGLRVTVKEGAEDKP